MNPEHPVYIISKGRWESRLTSKAFEQMGVPYHIVVEEQERPNYEAVIDGTKIITLDPAFRDSYDALCDLGLEQSKGSGPARNFCWEHAITRGATHHWVVDDNIQWFGRLHKNIKTPVRDGTIFKCMEDFVSRYRNVALAGPQYEMFTPRRKKLRSLIINTRIFSCILIRNDIPFRWRGRYNEDVILSIDVLKAGWCTILFQSFLQKKITTQKMKGGNTDELYHNGTTAKSAMLVKTHPDVAKAAIRYGRDHHVADLSSFKVRNKLLLRPDVDLDALASNEYGMRLVVDESRKRVWDA